MGRKTMSEMVGENIRRIRRERELTHQQMTELLADKGLVGPQGTPLSRSSLNQVETGKRAISVDDLLMVGDALGVCPALLLYPQGPDFEIGMSDDEDHTIPSLDLATWLWSPDTHPFTDPREKSERVRYSEAIGLADRLPPDEYERLLQTYVQAEPKTTKTDEERSER